MPIADVLELIDLSMGRLQQKAVKCCRTKLCSRDARETTLIKTEPTVLLVTTQLLYVNSSP